MPVPSDGHRGERRPRAALFGGLCVLAGGLGFASAVALGVQGEPPPARLVIKPAAAGSPTPTVVVPLPPRSDRASGARHEDAVRKRRRRPARPVAVVVPAIGLRARVVGVGLAADRSLHVPADGSQAGWWKGGARPGEAGPAVLVGHVDSKSGPAVFYRVGLLHRGDLVHVVGADGRVVRFRVRRVAHYAKRRFPTRRVYGPTRGPALRLITCSGQFDASTGHYLDNTVVYATRR
jgi:hypothetical protein